MRASSVIESPVRDAEVAANALCPGTKPFVADKLGAHQRGVTNTFIIAADVSPSATMAAVHLGMA